MRPYRDVATVAAAQVTCFLLLTYLEPNFFLIHFYESILYIAILLMLFYMEDRWAYMIGMLASVAWLGLGYESGILGSTARNLSEWGTAGVTAKLVALVALTTALLAVLMVTFCGRHWMKEICGTRERPQHVRRKSGNRRGVLRNPASVFLGNDPERLMQKRGGPC